ncbi:alpha/beta fold hydrolase [Streptomyces sp. NPDC090306]|uniref:alpha/beta fold hydrolase n=1 Tax=Streptomyces sp. NPDC090306 TaxID=3365961 RepID=UPI003806213E
MRIEGLDFAYERLGSGPPLLFLNGSGTTLAEVTPLLGLLAEDFEVVGFDQRGIGRTGLPGGPYTMADLAADALAVADGLGWRRFRLLGVSFGGMVAQELAVTAPERVERLALLCTSSGGAGGSSYPLHTLADLDEDERERVSARLFGTPPGHRRPAAGVAAAEGAALQLAARAGHDAFDRLPRIACPTFVASGSQDLVAPPERGAALAGRIPGAVARVFEGGHLFLIEDPDALPELLRFLLGEEHPAAAGELPSA